MSTARACVFTIAAKNYLHYARTLLDSVATHAPGVDRVLALCDRADGHDFSGDSFRVLELPALPLPDRDAFIFQYTLLELNTAIKPFVIEELFRAGYEQVIYFDPDICIYRDLAPLRALLDQHDVVLTPHLTQPCGDAGHPGDLEILQAGTYNLGFIGLRRAPDTARLVRWWAEKMERDCVVDLPRGLFVDQKWMDFAPAFVARTHIVRDPGWNAAYWNLAHRPLTQQADGRHAGDAPLTFFHFSGFNHEAGIFSKHQDRHTLDSLGPAGRALCDDYLQRLRRFGYPATTRLPYAYAAFSDGTPVPDAARALFRAERDTLPQRGADILGAGEAAFRRYLNEPATRHGVRQPLVSRLALKVYDQRHDLGLATQFPDPLGVHASAFAQWFVEQGGPQCRIPEPFLAPVRAALAAAGPADHAGAPAAAGPAGSAGLAKGLYKLAWRLEKPIRRVFDERTIKKVHGWLFNRAFVAPPPPARTASVAAATDFPPGLNVVGYLHAELGVGEAARATLRAAQAAGVPVSLVDYREGPLSRMEERVADELPRGARHGVNLFHINADQTPRSYADFGADFFAGHYNIGYWNWELPELPAAWRTSLDYLDEIWAPSSFVRDAVAEVARIPVTRIPYCVAPVVPPGVGRPELGLPTDEFVFLFVFDALSVTERKNPWGLLEAFRRARSSFQRPTRLVLKVSNAERAPATQTRLHRECERVGEVQLLDTYLRRPELNALFNACDGYVSLHRAEGFGFTLAEAMYLGKPVIATGWSSNMDFMTAWNSCPVRCREVELAEDHPPYDRGQRWADPDLDHAAECMVRLVNEPDTCAHIGAAGAAHIREHFSAAAVGALIRKRLVALGRI